MIPVDLVDNIFKGTLLISISTFVAFWLWVRRQNKPKKHP